MRWELAHNQTAARSFLRRVENAFTTRPDGTTWPKVDRTWRHADQYFRGLLRPGKRKSITGLAKRMDAKQERLERFVKESPWEADAVQEFLRNNVPEEVEDPTAAVVVDGTGIPKKGDHSVGVTDQYCGATGGVDNCQVTINCTLARPGDIRNADQVTWLLGSRLYLPKEWAGEDDSVYDDQAERERYAQLRADAAIPEAVGYQPKYDIAADLVEQVVDAGVEHTCVVADTNFGRRSTFRERLRDLEEPYVLEIETGGLHMVPEDAEVLEPGPTGGRPREYPTVADHVDPQPAAEIAEDLEEADWTEVTWTEGTNGDLTGSFYRARVRVCTEAYFGRVGERHQVRGVFTFNARGGQPAEGRVRLGQLH